MTVRDFIFTAAGLVVAINGTIMLTQRISGAIKNEPGAKIVIPDAYIGKINGQRAALANGAAARYTPLPDYANRIY